MNIKEVGEKYDLSTDTIRYWERVGVIPPVNRDPNDYRDFDEEDLEWVGHAKCMRDAGVSVEMLADYVQLFKEGDKTIRARKQILGEQMLLIKKMG
jgi:Predicted transcriptional regulators